MSAHVVTRLDNGVLSLTLARPEKKNALTLEMYDALTAGLDRAGSDGAVGAVLVTGAPGMFTAGNDLSDFLSNPPTAEDTPVFRFLSRLVSLEKPLVVAVDGVAVGVGTTLLLHADFVLATPRAKLMMPFVNLGLVPEAGASLLLPRLVGSLRAAEWLMLGEPIDVELARTSGLVTRVVEPEALLAEATAVAEKLAAKPRQAMRLTKQLLRARDREAVRGAMREEAAIFLERLGSDEARAAFMAFLAKK
jgi:enoyl-CoA hydratase/carnithine racemase